MRRRWIHRRGAVFRATLHPPGGTPAPGATGSDRPALARISSTFGWPSPLPDWVGLGIRILPDDDTDDRDPGSLDLLLASAAREPDLWCRLRAERDVLAAAFTSGVRYRVGGADPVVVAVPLDASPPTTLDQLLARRVACPLRYRVDLATEPGRWRGLGELELTEQLDDDPTLRFAPPRTGPRLITALRRWLYRPPPQ